MIPAALHTLSPPAAFKEVKIVFLSFQISESETWFRAVMLLQSCCLVPLQPFVLLCYLAVCK